MTLRSRELELTEDAPTVGASCPAATSRPCDVPGWVYSMDTMHPRMYGRCEGCGTRYVVVLPPRAGYNNVLLDGALQRVVENEDARDDRVIHATEIVLRRSGNAQRLWWVLRERPIAITRDILLEVEKLARRDVEEALLPRERLLTDLLELVHKRLHDVDEAYHRISKRALRGTAVRIRAALEKLRADVKRERPALVALRAERDAILVDIEAARARAQRDPLPLPHGYIPPPVDQARVLCDTITPTDVVYALVDAADPELVRYVGRTYDPVSRYRAHCTAGSDAVTQWAETLASRGGRPTMLLLERCARGDVEAREAYWIHHYRDRFQADLNRSIPRRSGC